MFRVPGFIDDQTNPAILRAQPFETGKVGPVKNFVYQAMTIHPLPSKVRSVTFNLFSILSILDSEFDLQNLSEYFA